MGENWLLLEPLTFSYLPKKLAVDGSLKNHVSKWVMELGRTFKEPLNYVNILYHWTLPHPGEASSWSQLADLASALGQNQSCQQCGVGWTSGKTLHWLPLMLKQKLCCICLLQKLNYWGAVVGLIGKGIITNISEEPLQNKRVVKLRSESPSVLLQTQACSYLLFLLDHVSVAQVK